MADKLKWDPIRFKYVWSGPIGTVDRPAAAAVYGANEQATIDELKTAVNALVQALRNADLI